jgi:hypothetical protein
MPLLDHFHPPLTPPRRWESLHAMWSGCLAAALNRRWLPKGYFADLQTHASARVEVDVATYKNGPPIRPSAASSSATTTLAAPWSPPAATVTLPAVFPETFEVRVMNAEGGTLVAAIELISPGNKDRAESRRNFAIKCASYLNEGVSLVLVDVVTSRHANLHQEIMRIMDAEESFFLRNLAPLYAVAYRPVLRDDREEIDLWPFSLAIGATLPVAPLRLTGDLFVPVNLEETYIEACERLGLV